MSLPGLQPVITGCGVLAANAVGREEFGRSLCEGNCAIADLVSFDASDCGRSRAAEILDFDVNPFLRSPKNYLDRNSALALAACEMALRESGMELPLTDSGCGACVGSVGGNLETLALFYARVREKGPRLAPPFLFPHAYYNTTAGQVSIEYDLKGPHMQFCSGGAAGLEAIAYATRCVGEGRAPMVLAGGVEAFNEWIFRVMLGRGRLAPIGDMGETCLPFGKRRNGAIMGEGAAFVIVESSAAAEARGAKALAQVDGCAVASTAQDAMLRALDSGNVRAAAVDAVFTSAGGYPEEDEAEAFALRDVFGNAGPAVVAVKSLLGETLGASGALNLAAAIAAIERGALPATAEAGESAFAWLDLVQRPRRVKVGKVMVNAGSPGHGHWTSLLVSKRVAGKQRRF